jgi:hypothetical protein
MWSGDPLRAGLVAEIRCVGYGDGSCLAPTFLVIFADAQRRQIAPMTTPTNTSVEASKEEEVRWLLLLLQR